MPEVYRSYNSHTADICIGNKANKRIMSGKHNSINYYKPSNNMGGRATSTIRLAAQHRSNTASAAAIERVQPRRRLSIAQDQLVRSRQNNRNVNEYGWQHGNRNMSISDDEDDALDLSPMCSPTAWIMQVGKECGSNASSVLSSISSMHSPNTNNNDDKYNYNVRKPDYATDQKKWRQNTMQEVLDQCSDDDCCIRSNDVDGIDFSKSDNPVKEFDGDKTSSLTSVVKLPHAPRPKARGTWRDNIMVGVSDVLRTLSSKNDHDTEALTTNSSISSFSYSLSKEGSAASEPRIVAPHVAKLSPQSVVEVRLQSISECVAVLCSVDVLKMRSGFFHRVLAEQEKSRVQGPSNATIWRDSITIPETSPFEAAAFLESLHEGRTIGKWDWNFCWSRLSVNWMIDELIVEYSAQIDSHVNKLLTLVHDNHWRCNSDVLCGMRVAAFRNSVVPVPTLLTGTIVASAASTSMNKIRVLFDSEKQSSFSQANTPIYNNAAGYKAATAALNTPRAVGITNVTLSDSNEGPVGDISEPFWISPSKDSAAWVEPDDFFIVESKRYISMSDKRNFWEMIRASIEFPELGCKAGISTAQELVAILKRPENKVLWTPDAPSLIPKEIAAELIREAYVVA